MKWTLSTLICLFISSANANYNEMPDFYPLSLVEKLQEGEISNKELKVELFKTLKDYHVKTKRRDRVYQSCPSSKSCERHRPPSEYKTARKFLFGLLHLEETSKGLRVIDQYCLDSYNEKDGVGHYRIPNHQKINCEHTWPQSKFTRNFSEEFQRNDLHHLFPVNSRANSTRSNLPFGEVERSNNLPGCSESSKGPSKLYGITSFEPPHSHKGNVARAVFYFSIRYNLPIDKEQEHYLRKWHREDPVDEFERYRNDEIFKIQKNRNPFIDAPELVYLISDF